MSDRTRHRAPESRTRTRRYRARAVGLLLMAAGAVPSFGCEGAIEEQGRREPGVGSTAGGPALGRPAAAPTGAPTPQQTAAADAAMRAENADLFTIAEQYFPNAAAIGGPTRLFRLTRTQLDLTTRALLPMQYQDSALDVIPRDPLQTNYEYSDNLRFNAANFTPYTTWVEQLSSRVRTAPSSIIACDAAKLDRACLKTESDKFVVRAFRGAVDPSELARFSGFFLASVDEVGLPDAAADLVTLALTSSKYVFRDEVTLSGGVLSPPQQLQNITYTLADSPPDALGFASANADQYVGTPDAMQRTIDKVLQTKESRQKLLRFFTAWLEVKDPAEFAIAPDVFPEFTPEVAAAAVEDTLKFLDNQLAGAAPRLTGVTLSTQSFISDAAATLYGKKAGRGTTGLTDLDPTQRLGIFTLPAVIASHSGPTTTRLIKRGVFFVRKVMCLPLGLPPPGVNTTLPMTAGATERERVEAATASATCQGCHGVINPFGFMQENYDAIGRWRTTEQGKPINASMQLQLLDEGPLSTTTPIDALKGITSSMRFQQCFARQLFRFYLGRDEQQGDDPTLRQMFFGFANQGEQNIVGMLETLARSSAFSQRSEARP